MNNRFSRRSLNLSFMRKKPTEYHYIQDFENTNEKICKKCDKDNDIIYARNCELYNRTKKFLEKNNAIFRMEGPPDPPRVPSNYQLFIIHRNRNSHTNNKIQTIAILFLLQAGYKLVIDPEVELLSKVMNKENRLFEPYMAIDIASSLNKNFVKEVAKFYELKGDRLDSPELLSLEEKIDRFNQKGMIHYIDVSGDSQTDRTEIPRENIIQRHFSAPAGTMSDVVLNDISSHEQPQQVQGQQVQGQQGQQPQQVQQQPQQVQQQPQQVQVNIKQPYSQPTMIPSASDIPLPAPSAPPPSIVDDVPPHLIDQQPPAYGFEMQTPSAPPSAPPQQNEDSKINIFINK